MKKPLFSRVIPIAALGLLVLFKFENCAPVSKFAGVPSGSSSGNVKIVDGTYQQSPVEFLAPSQTVTSPAATVKGVCVGVSDGTLVNWAVIPSQNPNQVINSGQVECQSGEFTVSLNGLNFSSCQDEFEVRAATMNDTSQTAVMFLAPDCPSATQ